MGSAKTTISHFYRQLFLSFRNHLDQSATCDEEVLHRLRVDIKYLRNTWRIAAEITGNKSLKTSLGEHILPLFRQSGAVRNLDVTIALAGHESTSASKPFLVHLKRLRTAERKKYKDLLAGYQRTKDQALHRDLTKQLAAIPEDKVQEAAHRLMHKKENKVRKMLGEIKTPEDLHDVRKQLKIIKTVCRLLLTLSPDETLRKQLKKVKRAEEKIGNWHDLHGWSESLDRFLQNSRNSAPHAALQKSADQLRSDVEHGLHKIVRRLQKHYAES